MQTCVQIPVLLTALVLILPRGWFSLCFKRVSVHRGSATLLSRPSPSSIAQSLISYAQWLYRPSRCDSGIPGCATASPAMEAECGRRSPRPLKTDSIGNDNMLGRQRTIAASYVLATIVLKGLYGLIIWQGLSEVSFSFGRPCHGGCSVS